MLESLLRKNFLCMFNHCFIRFDLFFWLFCRIDRLSHFFGLPLINVVMIIPVNFVIALKWSYRTHILYFVFFC